MCGGECGGGEGVGGVNVTFFFLPPVQFPRQWGGLVYLVSLLTKEPHFSVTGQSSHFYFDYADRS